MAVQLGINAYVTVDVANAFFLDRLDATAWQSASEEKKGQSLVTATQLLDSFNWAGTAVSTSQPLAFPRIVEYFEPKAGVYVYLDGSSIPDRIVNSCLELAYHLLNNEGVLDSSGTVRNLAVGSIKLEDIQATPRTPMRVRTLMKPLLADGGFNGWWRSN